MLLALTLSPAWAAPCGPPAPLVRAEATGSEAVGQDCVTLDVDVGVRGFLERPADGVSRGVELQRFRTEMGLRTRSDVQTRVAFLAARSGGDGQPGIDGEAIVPELQIAEARWDWRRTGLAFAGGLVDDAWVMIVQPAWGRIELARPLVTEQGWLPRADAGAFVSWTAPDDLASITASVTTGEGFKLAERNDSADLTGVATVRPLAHGKAPLELEIALMARDGTRGSDAVRDDRAGAAVIVRHPAVVGGVDALLGWGLGGDAALAPAGVSAWVRTGPAVPAIGVARLDRATDARDVAGSGETLGLVAGGLRLPLRREGGPAHLVAGWQGRRADEGVDDLWFVQLGARLAGSLALEAR